MVGRSRANISFAISGDILIEMRSVEIICGGYRLTYCIVCILHSTVDATDKPFAQKGFLKRCHFSIVYVAYINHLRHFQDYQPPRNA